MKSLSKRYRFFSVALAMAAIIMLAGTGSFNFQRFPLPLGAPSAQAQPAPLRRIDPTTISAQVYELLPDLPLENQYISSETGAPATDNTLVSRMIRYHIYIKERPTNFRLDWKLTLADYFGAFERISADRYPDYGLRDNPLEGDRTVIQTLSPEQRDQLVNALYETFTPAES